MNSELREFVEDCGTAQPMCPALFKQRRRVIDLVYDAKEVLVDLDLPRVEVRIVNFHDDNGVDGHPLGMAILSDDLAAMLIDCGRIAELDDNWLRFVVWHELVHTWFHYSHVENSPAIADVLAPLMHKSVAIVRDLYGEVPGEKVLVDCLERIAEIDNEV